MTFVVKYQMKTINLKSHIESVHKGKKPYECDICGRVLDEEQNFKSNIESVHEKQKPQKYGLESIQVFYYLRCLECEFKTKEENNFEDYAIKNNPMSFERDICGKVFDEEKNFKSHIESVHEGKKP